MNLMHLVAKRDPNLIVGPSVRQIKIKVNGHVYNGFAMPPGAEGEIRVKTVFCWYPFCKRPVSPDWLIMREPGKAAGSADVRDADIGRLLVRLVGPDEGTCAQGQDEAGRMATPVHLPYIEGPLKQQAAQSLDLVLRNVSPGGESLYLLVTETVPTEPLYAQAVGFGVELGPGPNPRLMSNATREVVYIERDPIDKWREKYSFTGRFASLDSVEAEVFWRQYTVGQAHDLPFDDARLDFIFSADVLEHLVNPLGHLAYWRKKLRPGGRLIKIVPHISGCLDYRNRPTDFAWLLEQYRRGNFAETVEHHAPYARARGIEPEVLLQRGFSSHFSFFSEDNINTMLDFAVRDIGYSGHNVYYGRNGKKLHFILYN